MKVILTEQQAKKLLDYLTKQSWGEVNDLIVMINNSCVAEEDNGNI